MKQLTFVIPMEAPEIEHPQGSMIQATPGSVDAAKIAKMELPRGVPRSRLTVWLVDGKLIRDSLDTDFIGGGHFFRYQWIPEGEIWLENDTPTNDVKFFLLHELCERALMVDGMEYDEAHSHAAEKEALCRKSPETLDESISRAIVKNIKAERK
jgi:hypothetical protein